MNHVLIKRVLLAAGAAMALASAYAASDTQEATPYSNSPAQARGEQHKKVRPAVKVKKVKDGSTARGEGSGIAQANRPEAAGQQAADKREARPHKDSQQGATPK